ncbi:sensor histidine kinase [Paenalkalicoccus suaedae]|uniref:histidine kinase n=1 Tax=Paenalkalicoccus suaedae TaxID=2592382 RepID=A0A859FHT4_9BACI|nr:sensor histidine kinase [Paenalkalicoccus suaedae]QKS72687.1 sensor histidine kinase [Paenalkalicoccus suaedae]
MFFAYLLYKKSWIAMIGFLLLLTNGLLYFDAGIRVDDQSLIYLNGLFIMTCTVFFFWRYTREVRYIRSLALSTQEVEDDWAEALPEPRSAFPDKYLHASLLRVAEHHNEKLERHQSAHRMQTQDVASWVHEVKAPLTAMKITLDANQSHELAQKLQPSWLRIHLLIDQQLYLSRLVDLEKDLLPAKHHVIDIVKEEIRELATWCFEKDVAIHIEEQDEATAYTDKKWCGFVIRQLLTNAIKYSPTGGEITITSEYDPERKSTRVTISDQGPGIAAHDLPRIYDKGFTGENGRVQHAATGMGLYLAKEISDKLHVKLQADSAVGEGTSMSIRFPPDNQHELLRRSTGSTKQLGEHA